MAVLALSLVPEGIGDVALFFVLGTASVILVSMAKAGFGGGVGLLSVPLMIYACGGRSQLANGIMLPILILNDYVALAAWRGKWKLRVVLLLLPGMVIGTALGWLAIHSFQQMSASSGSTGHQERADAALMFGVGFIAVGFVILQAIRARRAEPLPFRPVLWQGTCVGTAAGFTSTLAHAAGPIANMYMLPQRLPKEQFVASTLLYFWIGNQIKLVPYWFLGLLNTDSMGGFLAFVPAVVVGTALGVYLNRRVGHRQFLGVVYVLLALTGVHLLVTAARTLWF